MQLYKLLLASVIFFSFPAAIAQQAEKKLVLTFPDSLAKKLENIDITIDTYDNYCYYNLNREGVVVTNLRTFGPFQNNDYRSGVVIYYSIKDRAQYIKGKNNTMMYGPFEGHIELTSRSHFYEDYFHFIVFRGNSFDHYINGYHIATTDSFPCTDDWCVVSNNGNVLYTIKKNRLNYLYLNYKLIDSTQDDYDWMHVDDDGDFCYTLGVHKVDPTKWLNQGEFIPYPPIKQKVFRQVAIDEQERYQYQDSIYLYQNNPSGFGLHAVNRTQWKREIRAVITAHGRRKYSLSYIPAIGVSNPSSDTDNAAALIYVNDTPVKLPYTHIFLPCIDSLGNYALFGQRGYFMYRNVNGKEHVEPLSQHGVRAKPISIDAKGNTICSYETDDSVYVYENNRLFGKCAIAQYTLPQMSNIVPLPSLRHYLKGKPPELSFFCLDTACYVVYRNAISPPLLKFETHLSGERIAGHILYADYNTHGYCLLQKTGDHSYSLMVNNRNIPIPPGADLDTPLWYVLSQNFLFTGKEFIFYSKEGNNIYRYKMRL